MASQPLPVLIVGAGISGLTLAQHLRQSDIPFILFERDETWSYRGVGWGLTIHWALPALRSVLPPTVVERLPEAYVDRPAVERGSVSTFPFIDLSTGERKFTTPAVGSGGAERIRVTRQRFRKLLATDVEVKWGKAFDRFDSAEDSVTVYFEDGSSYRGSLLVACDGSQSRIRRAMFPATADTYKLPIRLLGLKVNYPPERLEQIQRVDPLLFQGVASKNDSYLYFSILDSPNNNDESTDKYTCQMCLSWPYRPGFFSSPEPIDVPSSNADRLGLVKRFAQTWTEPYRSLVLDVPDTTEVTSLQLQDWPPPKGGLRGSGRVLLMGDAFHPMVMYRGEGANHAIVDVQEFAAQITPLLRASAGGAPLQANGNGSGNGNGNDNGRPQSEPGFNKLRDALDKYEDAVGARTRTAVLASRQACLDAHSWEKITEKSPLIQKRIMRIEEE